MVFCLPALFLAEIGFHSGLRSFESVITGGTVVEAMHTLEVQLEDNSTCHWCNPVRLEAVTFTMGFTSDFFFLHCRASTGHGRSTLDEC